MERAILLSQDELERVNAELSSINFDSDNIRNSMHEFLVSGSKRIRTIVTVLYLKACGCKNFSDSSYDILTAGEVIHNASLLHDDVLDGAKYRRNKKTVSEEYSPYISILAGDYLLSVATEKLLKINDYNILKIFLDCTKNMCSAEINQFFCRGKKPSLEEYISVCEGKTACLFNAIMESCSIVEGINISKDFAMNFGILFQLKNDLSDNSIKSDKENKIYTPKDFIGIEKTVDLIDNYLEKLRRDIEILPDNDYKEGLGELLKSL